MDNYKLPIILFPSNMKGKSSGYERLYVMTSYDKIPLALLRFTDAPYTASSFYLQVQSRYSADL